MREKIKPSEFIDDVITIDYEITNIDDVITVTPIVYFFINNDDKPIFDYEITKNYKNMEQRKLFELPEDIHIDTTGLTCSKCKHIQSWQCNSKVFHYCGIRKSKKTNNKLLKIKCKNAACSLYEPFC
jgi:hypothetical protein